MNFGSLLAAGWLHTRKLKRAPALLSFLLLLASVLTLSGISHAQNPEIDVFRQNAVEQKVADSRYWQILLHYKTDMLGSTISLIDDPDFFLASRGKTDPAAELDATLVGLWQEQNSEQPQQHVRCRFPARSQWLIETLNIASESLPPATCSELDETLQQINPRSAMLIFPGNHNNSPASMFGHTLISIQGEHSSRLLSYAVNYAAHTDETNGFAYAVKGIFGLYPGYYSLLPYYAKVREYNDLERRDVWEYQLNLTPEETRRMTLHIWELREISSEYYFFDENCSYNLLFLLEAGRPSLNLTDPCRPWVIPIDTVRIIGDAGLVENVDYRPSKATRIQKLARQMDRQETGLAQELIDNQVTAEQILESKLSRQGKIRVLDVASETLEFRYYRQEIERDDYRSDSLSLLKSRSKLGLSEQAAIDITSPGHPERGHGSNRLALGIGRHDKSWYQELRLRPAYHNLLDDDQGYLPGSQIDFANLVLRYLPDDNRLQLQRFDLIDIVSLSPRHAFYRPVSWKVSTGLLQFTFDDQNDHLVYRLNPGGGFTWGNSRAMIYGLVETDLLFSGRFDNSFTGGLGGSIGLLSNPLPVWKVYITGRQIWYEEESLERALELSIKQNWRVSANISLVLEVSRQYSYDHYFTDSSFLFNLYW